MRQQPRRNEARFYRYPMRRVAAIINDNAGVQTALHALQQAGVDVTKVNVLSGPEGARLLDRTGTGHGLGSRIETTDPIDAFARAVTCEDVSATGFVDLFQSLGARLLRLAQWGAYEGNALQTHERALNDGHHVIFVPVRSDDQRSRVVDILRTAGGYYLLHFRLWSIEMLQ
jgi:hypothetical protein